MLFLLGYLLTLAPFCLGARLLVFTRTVGFRHDSIPAAVEALQARASTIGVAVDHTEDPAIFSDDTLSAYDAIVFLSTTGDVLDDTGKSAFQAYLDLGGNFVGIHSASDTLNTTSFYGDELGAYFDYHPVLQNATVVVLDAAHLSTEGLPTRWPVQDEIYNFKSDPRDVGAIVVLTVDESSYTDDGTRRFDQGDPHPIAWYQEHGAGTEGGGRSFYTALGHLNKTWEDDTFMGHLLGGIQWVLEGNTTRAYNSSASVGSSQEEEGEGYSQEGQQEDESVAGM